MMLLCASKRSQNFGEDSYPSFYMTGPTRTGSGNYKEMGSPGWIWRNLTGLRRPQTPAPSSTSGMNWHGNWEAGLIAQRPCWTFANALVSEWEKIPAAGIRDLEESLKT